VLLRDGRALFTGPASAVARPDDAGQPVGVAHVNGSVTLGNDLAPGVYALQVSLAEGEGRRPAATQWVEFEVR
jgi:hypothetical protein